MASIAVETTVDADVVEIVVAPRGYLKNVFKVNIKQPSSVVKVAKFWKIEG